MSCFNGQTTNVQSPMVAEALGSISLHQRSSTANSRIIGYSQQEMGMAVEKLLRGEVDAAGCVALMDEYRIAAAMKQGIKYILADSGGTVSRRRPKFVISVEAETCRIGDPPRPAPAGKEEQHMS